MRKTLSIIRLLKLVGFVWMALWASAALAADVSLSEFPTTWKEAIGIDFHEPNGGSLIMSVNYNQTGALHNLELVDKLTAQPFSDTLIQRLQEKIKVATVRTSAACQQFPVGDVFIGNGQPGEIVRIDQDGYVFGPSDLDVPGDNSNPGNPNPGSAVNESWVKLPNETEQLRGSLYVDRGCAFGGDLIVVTGNEGPTGGGNVWRVKKDGTATLVASITDPDNPGVPVHLEGLITLPNDAQSRLKYGPLAGTIIAGDENYNTNPTKDGRIWSISNCNMPGCATATPYTLAYTDPITGLHHPVKPEDLDLIEAGGDFFGINYGNQRILTAPASNFTAFVGDILVTQEFPLPDTTGLYVAHWNGTKFEVTELKFSQRPNTVNTINQWEHVTIAPSDVQVDKCIGFTPPPAASVPSSIYLRFLGIFGEYLANATAPPAGAVPSSFDCSQTATINVGGTAAYAIYVTPLGPADSLNVVLTDILPSGLTWTVGGDTATCNGPWLPGGSTLTCNFGTIPLGEQRVITLVAEDTTVACGSFPNTATVTSDNDSNSDNNSSSATIGIGNCIPVPAQLAVVKTPDNGTFTQGSQVSFTIKVSNPAAAGAQAATTVMLTDTLPTAGGLSWLSATTTAGSCTLSGTNNSSLACSLGAIAPQASVTVTLLSTATTPLAACQSQPNPAAIATAAGGLQAQDSGSLTCTPPVLACPAGSFNFSVDGSGNLNIVYDQFPAPNDNSYGANAVGWGTKGHTFGNLTGSDHAGFQLVDPSGVVRLDFNIDYLTATIDKINFPSGFRSFGPFGGDGKVNVGSLVDQTDITYSTSLARNLNNTNIPGLFLNGVQQFGTGVANVLVDSPPTVDKISNYTLTSGTFAGWDFHNTYFVTIKKAKLQAIGFLDKFGNPVPGWKVQPNLDALHNSPAKPCPPTSGGGSCAIDDGPVTSQKTQFRWELTNTGTAAAVLTAVSITWPTANGKLKKIKFDGDVVYDTPDVAPPSVTLTSAQLTTDANKKTIGVGKTRVFILEFEKNVANSPYLITLKFGAGCEVRFDSSNQPPQLGACADLKPIEQMVLEYAGTTAIQNVAFYRTSATGTPSSSDLMGNTGPLTTGAIFSFGNYDAANATNDVDFLITFVGGATQKSRFHLSCSDPEMNDVTDCGTLQGNAKDNSVTGGNLWFLRDLQGHGKHMCS